MTDFDRKDSSSNEPQVSHGPVPLWIKIMWAAGISWVLIYVIWGLRNTPLSW